MPGTNQDPKPGAGAVQKLILGIGTGRCGSHSLTELLNSQPDARFTHEQPPLLAWRSTPGRPGVRERFQRFRRTRSQQFIGDVASFYLPHLPEALALEPGCRVICLERPREEVVSSFCRWLDTVHPLPTNHWAADPAEGWYHEPIWTRIFPQYDLTDREEGIRRYWDEYHDAVVELARRFPENLRVFSTDEALNTESGVRELLTFAGFPADRQLVATGARKANTEKARPHPRRAALENVGPRHPSRCAVLVPFSGSIVPACDNALRGLERKGYPVWRIGGYAAIDQGRNQIATDCLVQGFEETMWIDSDVVFDPDDVDRLRAHDLPIVSAIYPKKGKKVLASHVLPGTSKIVFGDGGGLIEILYAAAGFLLVRRQVYMDVVRQLSLPICNELFDRPTIPFFRPMIRDVDDSSWYLAEDFAFCENARRCGHRVYADTTIRLWHVGQYSYGWEDSGISPGRFKSFTLSLD